LIGPEPRSRLRCSQFGILRSSSSWDVLSKRAGHSSTHGGSISGQEHHQSAGLPGPARVSLIAGFRAGTSGLAWLERRMRRRPPDPEDRRRVDPRQSSHRGRTMGGGWGGGGGGVGGGGGGGGSRREIRCSPGGGLWRTGLDDSAAGGNSVFTHFRRGGLGDRLSARSGAISLATVLIKTRLRAPQTRPRASGFVPLATVKAVMALARAGRGLIRCGPTSLGNDGVGYAVTSDRPSELFLRDYDGGAKSST